MPRGFKKWLDDNEERIADSKSLPYFLKDNGELVDGKYELTLSTLQNQPLDNLTENEAKIASVLGISKGEVMTFERANELRKAYLPQGVFENKNPDTLFLNRTLDIKSMNNTKWEGEIKSKRKIQKRLKNTFKQADDAFIEIPDNVPLDWIEDAIKGELASCSRYHKVYLKYKNELFIY